MSISGKRAFVTGGGSGIGLSIAKRLASAGAHVTVSGRNRAALEASELAYAVMDVTNEESVNRAIKQAGDIDIFIANAGAVETAPAVATKSDMWARMVSVNLTSVFLCSRAVLPPMIERGWGRFIAIGSTASLKGYAYAGAYAAAKHGVIGWIRSLASELGKTGVTANAVCPGYTDTQMVRGAVDKIVAKTGRTPDEARAELVRAMPMQRLIQPDEVAGAVLWLCGDGAGGVSGQAIAIDGGETAT